MILLKKETGYKLCYRSDDKLFPEDKYQENHYGNDSADSKVGERWRQEKLEDACQRHKEHHEKREKKHHAYSTDYKGAEKYYDFSAAVSLKYSTSSLAQFTL